jgi:hypothetical protein
MLKIYTSHNVKPTCNSIWNSLFNPSATSSQIAVRDPLVTASHVLFYNGNNLDVLNKPEVVLIISIRIHTVKPSDLLLIYYDDLLQAAAGLITASIVS